jgi:predicted nucleic acid-binding protein
MQIISEFGIYAYDAYFIKCAMKYKSALITLDRGMAQVAQAMNIEVIGVNR